MRGKASFLSSGASSTRITPAYAGKSCRRIHLSNQPKDHPRLCGEKAVVFSDAYDNLGSPPPMRGKVLWSGCTPYASKDHPRLCGEKYGYYTIEVSSLGSPPPMRGKAALPACLHFFTRITPAYAGKREKRFSLPANIRDHPRLCGEKRQLESLLSSDRGSPPPMRGKAENACVTDEGNRITPAYAGKSVIVAFVFFKSWDHPRLCGEKFIRITPIKDTPGSPPPMRGKECYTNGSCAVHRITPAYAGKSFRTAKRSQEHRDHPRLCGEKCSDSEFFYQNLGSPPPMRGKDSQRAFHGIMTRITPAYAGKSRTTARAIFRQKDHPRLCGEKFVKCSRSFTLSGSPPPMRGKGYRCW